MLGKGGAIHRIQIGLLLLFITLGFLIIQPLHAFAKRYTEDLKNVITPRLETLLGIQLRYDSISPSILSSITIQNLEIKFKNGDFSAKKFRLQLNPFKALRQLDNDPMQWISGVSIATGHIDLVISDNNQVFANPDQKNLWSLLESKTVTLKDFSSNISSPRIGRINARDLVIQLEGFEDRIRYRFSGSLESDSPVFPDTLGTIKTALNSSGGFSPSEEVFNGRIDIHELSSELLTLKSLSADLTHRDGQTLIRRIEDGRPIDIHAQFEGNNIEINGQMVEFVLEDIVGPGSTDRTLAPWLKTVSTGDFSVNWDRVKQDIQYKADMTISIPEKTGLPWPWVVTANLEGNRTEASIDTISVALPHAIATYSGQILLADLYPTGKLDLRVDDDMLGYPVSASFRITTTTGVIVTEAIYMMAGELEFSNFDILVVQEPQRVTASLSATPISSNADNTSEMYHAYFDVMRETGNSPIIYGAAAIRGLEAVHAAQLLNAGYLANYNPVKDSVLNVDGMFVATPQTWSAQIENVSLVSKSNPANTIVLQGQLTPNNYFLDSIKVSWNEFYAIGNGFSNNTVHGGTAQGRFLVGNALFPVEASWTRKGSLWMTVSDQIDAILGPPTSRGRTLSVKTNQIDIPIRGGAIQADFELNGRVAQKNWTISIAKSRFDLSRADRNYSAEISGRIQEERINLENIQYTDDFGSLYGQADFVNDRSSRYLAANLALVSEEQEAYNLSIAQSGTEWNIDMVVNAGKLERVNLPGLRGLFNLQANLVGPLEDPSISLDVSTSNSFYGSSPFNVYGKGELQENNLRFSDIEILLNGIFLSDGIVLANMETGSIRGTANLNATYNQVPVSTGFSFGINIDETLAWQNIAALGSTDFKGTLATHAVLWMNLPTCRHSPSSSAKIANIYWYRPRIRRL